MSTVNVLEGLFGPSLQFVLLCILLKRRLYKRFRVFCAFCVWTICATAIGLASGSHPLIYFIAYWLAESGGVVLAFLAILAVLRPFTQLAYVRHPWSRFLLVPYLLLLVGSCFWPALFSPINRSATGRFASAIYVFVGLMCVAEFVLFLVSFRVRGRYPIRWTQYEFGILSGFGILAILTLVADTPTFFRLFHLAVPFELEKFFQYFRPGAFVGSAVVWLIAFWKPEPPRRTDLPNVGRLEDALRVLQEQIEVVKELGKLMNWRLAAARLSNNAAKETCSL